MELTGNRLKVALKLLFPGPGYRGRAARYLGMTELNLWAIMAGRHRLGVRHKNRLVTRAEAMRKINRDLVIERVMAQLELDVAAYDRAAELLASVGTTSRASSRPVRVRVGRPRSRVARLTRAAVAGDLSRDPPGGGGSG
jgi:hypothetical protein